MSPELPFLLISGARRLASYNSWTHNIPALMEKMKGNWATLNPQDAKRLGIENGQPIRVTSATGSVEIGVVVSPDVRVGVIVMHQFWGHTYDSGTRTSRKYPGVNVNFLHVIAFGTDSVGCRCTPARPAGWRNSRSALAEAEGAAADPTDVPPLAISPWACAISLYILADDSNPLIRFSQC